MSYTFRRNQNPAAYIVVLNEDFQVKDDLLNFYSDLLNGLETEVQAISTIIETLNYDASFNDMLSATKDILELDKNALPFNHPKSKQLIMVTDNGMIKMSMDGFRKFGIVQKFQVVKTLDEALQLV